MLAEINILLEKQIPLYCAQLTQNLKESLPDVGGCDCVPEGTFTTVERANAEIVMFLILYKNSSLM
jgi:hypothetical protein